MEKNLDNLTKHLKELDLSIDKVEADGDCAFRSIVRQIHRKKDMFSKETRQHIKSLGLCTDEEQDITLLRSLFVEKIAEKDPELQEFLADKNENDISRLAEEFRQPGFWANDIGDFVMKACCIIIKIPITLVTSNEKKPYIEFSSRANFNEEPLYLAFDSNHYDATITKGSKWIFPEDLLAEISLEFSEKVDVNEKGSDNQNHQLDEVLRAEMALRNTSGGLIIIHTEQEITVRRRDEWMKKLFEKRKTLLGSECGEKDSIASILDFKSENNTIYIFVRKSSVPIITSHSGLRERSTGRNYPVKQYSRICEVLQKKTKKCTCAEREENFKTSFKWGNKLLHETETEEHKYLTSQNLGKSLCKKLNDNIVSFANTRGGTVYFGIEDTDANIKGQKIKDEKEKKDIQRCIDECMKRKLWVSESGERDNPVEGNHYHVQFFPVKEADENTFVIAVHICLYPGTAVFKKEPVCSVLNQDNQIVNMDFQTWLALHKTTPIGDDTRKKFDVRNENRTSVYISVKETVQHLVDDLRKAEASTKKVHWRPQHAVKWIDNQGLASFVESINHMFEANKWEGIAFIERCWRVNLGLENTKPAEVVCDILVCSPNVPLVLVSLTETDVTRESEEYNRKLATKLKRSMVQEGGCLEKFYIMPVTISLFRKQPHLSDIISSIPDMYPDSYHMCTEKYTNILEALVLLLARANSMATHAIGRHLFTLLTEQQYEILHEFYESTEKLMITGPPGSGKTVLALERIYRLRLDGASHDEVLFVCTNKPLLAQIKNIKKKFPDGFCIAMSYFEIIDLLKSGTLPKQLRRVKHVLADEAQNYLKDPDPELIFDWWSFLMMNIPYNDSSSRQSLWVFSDVSQQTINQASVNDHLKGFTRFRLKTVIRTTGKIHTFISDTYLKPEEADVKLGHDFEGEEVEVLIPSPFNTDKKKKLSNVLFQVLHRLIIENGHSPDRIAVLFNDIKENKEYESLFSKSKIPISPVRNGEEVSKHGIVFDTIRRYSGVEKDIIVGFCPKFHQDSPFQNNDGLMVTLCSRARLKLILIFEDEEKARLFHLSEWKMIPYCNK